MVINIDSVARNAKARKVLKDHALVMTLASALTKEGARATIGAKLRQGKLTSTIMAKALAHNAKRAIEALGSIPEHFAGAVYYGAGLDALAIDADTARGLNRMLKACTTIREHMTEDDAREIAEEASKMLQEATDAEVKRVALEAEAEELATAPQ